MKLRNKKTGVIRDFIINKNKIQTSNAVDGWKYTSLAELNEEWGDYEEPKERHHWFISGRGTIEYEKDEDDYFNRGHKSIGNYFETKEEAEKAVEKLKAWKRLKDKGFKTLDWSPYRINNPNRDDHRECIFKIVFDIEKYESKCDKDLDLLFGGEE